jgi:hypothetical protein
MVDVSVLGTDVKRRVGSSPTKGNSLYCDIEMYFLNKIII